MFSYNSTEMDGKTRLYGAIPIRWSSTRIISFEFPQRLPSRGAAPLLCAGITTDSPLKNSGETRRQVGVVGLGGLGHMGVKIANAMGAEVTVSHCPKKEAGRKATWRQSTLSSPRSLKL